MNGCPSICISQSRLVPIQQCLHNFMVQYGISGESADYGANDSEDAMVGTALHALRAMEGEWVWSQRRTSDHVHWDATSVKVIAGLPLHRQAKARDVADKMREMFLLDRKALDYIFERRYALRWPELTPCNVGEDCDRVEFTIDELCLYLTRADLTDLKAGYSRHAGQIDEDAFDDVQLLVYILMVFHLFPPGYIHKGKVLDIQEVSGKLEFAAFGPKNNVTCTFTRETIETHEIDWEVAPGETQRMTIRQVLQWSFDRVRAAYGMFGPNPNNWPAHRHHSVCRWCRLRCPLWTETKARYMNFKIRRSGGKGSSPRKVAGVEVRTSKRPIVKIKFGGK